jgi:hypothetical protein
MKYYLKKPLKPIGKCLVIVSSRLSKTVNQRLLLCTTVFISALFSVLSSVLLIAITPSQANAAQLPHSNQQFQFSFAEGPISGYVQTPRGGRIGSSDVKQPTLLRLGISRGLFSDDMVEHQYGPWCFYRGYEQIRPDAIQELTLPLLTYGIHLPRGMKIKSDLQFDWYRLGGCYRYYLLTKQLFFAPEMEFIWWDFAYRFQALKQVAVRAYHHAGLRFGFHTNYHYSPLFSIGLHLAKTLTFSQFDISTFSIKLKVNLSQNEGCFVGVRRIRIGFTDAQAMPNDIFLQSKLIPIAGCGTLNA